MMPTRAAIYVRVSRDSQTCENQLLELRQYVAARGWSAVEYVDQAVSGSKESRPALDRLVADARRRKVDVICAWSLDRIGRNLRALVLLVDELASLNVTLVTLKESIDLGSASGRLMLHVMSALAEFEKSRVIERVKAGLARAKANGKRLGRQPYDICDARFQTVAGLSLRDAGKALNVSRSVIHRWRRSHPVNATAA